MEAQVALIKEFKNRSLQYEADSDIILTAIFGHLLCGYCDCLLTYVPGGAIRFWLIDCSDYFFFIWFSITKLHCILDSFGQLFRCNRL